MVEHVQFEGQRDAGGGFARASVLKGVRMLAKTIERSVRADTDGDAEWSSHAREKKKGKIHLSWSNHG